MIKKNKAGSWLSWMNSSIIQLHKGWIVGRASCFGISYHGDLVCRVNLFHTKPVPNLEVPQSGEPTTSARDSQPSGWHQMQMAPPSSTDTFVADNSMHFSKWNSSFRCPSRLYKKLFLPFLSSSDLYLIVSNTQKPHPQHCRKSTTLLLTFMCVFHYSCERERERER